MASQPMIPIKEVNFKPLTKTVVSKVEYTKIVQQAGGESLTINTSNLESIFELPARVMNLSKSHLSFTATVDAQAALTMSWLNITQFGVRQIQLYTRSGVMLCDINDLHKYTSVVNPFETKKSDAVFYDEPTSHSTAIPQCAGTETLYRADNSTVPNNVYEPTYFNISAAAAANVVTYNIPLSVVKNSILALDKSLYFNETILLKLVWNTAATWGGTAQSATDATATPGAMANDIEITKLALYLALERNPFVSSAVIEKTINQGNVINCPYVYVFKNVPGASTSQSISIRFNRSNGSHLKKIYHTLYDNDQTDMNQFIHDGSVLSSYYTAINNQRLQQFDLNITNKLDYMYMYDEILKDSVLDNYDTFLYNWAHVDKFEDVTSEDPNDNIVSGLPLDVEQKWDINCTTGAATAYPHFTFAITNRPLIISAAGIVFA